MAAHLSTLTPPQCARLGGFRDTYFAKVESDFVENHLVLVLGRQVVDALALYKVTEAVALPDPDCLSGRMIAQKRGPLRASGVGNPS